MPVCSYVIIPKSGALRAVERRLHTLPGCDVVRADNQELLLLVTDTPGPEEDRVLRSTIEEIEGIHALVLAFGEIDPDTQEADPLGPRRGPRGRSLPVLDPGGLRDGAPLPTRALEVEDP